MGRIQDLLVDNSPSDNSLVIAYQAYQRSMDYLIIEPSEETESLVFQDTRTESDEELPF